jgi:hypothetical protein
VRSVHPQQGLGVESSEARHRPRPRPNRSAILAFAPVTCAISLQGDGAIEPKRLMIAFEVQYAE